MKSRPRPLTHKKQRKLINEQVRDLLIEYVETNTTYVALSKKYGISTHTLKQIVAGVTYRELSSLADLRFEAQTKAAARNKKRTNAEALRVRDSSQPCIPIDFGSVVSIQAAQRRFDSALSLLCSAEEAQPTHVLGSDSPVKTTKQVDEHTENDGEHEVLI